MQFGRVKSMLTPVLVVALGASVLVGPASSPAAADGNPLDGPEYRRIIFPVQGPVSYTDTFGACRDGCSRRHEGNDLMGRKLQPLLAATDGVVAWMRNDGAGRSGNMVSIRDAQGWEYRYIHLNNDTPGTDDGANPPEWAFGPGIKVGAKVKYGQLVGYLGDSGNAEGTAPHLHFEIRRPDGTAMNPYASLRLAQGLPAGTRCSYDTNPANKPRVASGRGYWVAGSDGSVTPFGSARHHGSMAGTRLNAPVVGMTPTTTGAGYWLLGRDGGIFSFGDARFYGSTGAMRLNAPVVSMAASPGGGGYWLLGRDGGVFSYGNARFHGSTGDMVLDAPVVAMAATPDGGGYWLVATDGGVFSFGNARFHGSTGGRGLRHEIVGMTPTASGGGYWLLAENGEVFAFGDARWSGGLDRLGLCTGPTALAMASTSTGRGYWILQGDGRVRTFGDAYWWSDPKVSGRTGTAFAVLPPAPPAG